MELIEKFEVKYKDKYSQTQRTKLLDALKDLYVNIDDYDIVKRNDSNDQTDKFMDKFFISKGDIITLLEDYAFNLNVTEYGDILIDRDRPNNLLYILYIPNAKVGNWDYAKSREKLLYIKWNPINRKIISFHTMKKVQDTNRDELTESKNMSIQKVIDFIYTHTTDDYIIVDVSILEELNDCLKSKEKPTYSFAEIKAVKDDIIYTMSLNDEQKETLNEFVAELDSTFYHGDKLEEKKKYEIYNTHVKIRYGNRDVLEYYDSVSNNLFIVYDGYIEYIDQLHSWDKFEDLFSNATLVKDDSKVVKIWKRDRKLTERLEENLSYNDIIDRVFYTGNDNWHLKKFYDLRKKYNGKDVKNVHLITTEINDDGSCDILFAVDATKDNTKKKELVFGGNGAMIDNVSNEYQVVIRINDFWELLDYFDLETKGDFSKEDLVALVQLSEDIKIDSNDPSWWWQGLAYWCSLDDGAINPCNIRPKFWDAYRPNVKVSKIVEAVLRQFGFFTQQIAMSIKRALIEQGYLEKA